MSFDLSLDEYPVHPDEVKLMRMRIMRRPLKPFQLFTGPKTLAEILKGTDIDIEEVKRHSNELKPGLWCFNIATNYSSDAVRVQQGRNLGLVSIAANPQALCGANGGERCDNSCVTLGTKERRDVGK